MYASEERGDVLDPDGEHADYLKALIDREWRQTTERARDR